MKTLFKNLAVVCTLLLATTSFAASDYFLELDGVKGECKGKHIKLTENSDGSFTAENIPAGTYNIVYKAKQGKTGSTKRGDGSVVLAFEGVISPRDAASGLPTGKRSSIQSPRDPASGQATGKRQHKPISISKEWDANTPMLIMGQIVVGDLDGDGVAAQGDPVHGIDIKIGAKSTSTAAPVHGGWDIKLAKKV
jgi:hypothetical protein